jgi:hypothetical protein
MRICGLLSGGSMSSKPIYSNLNGAGAVDMMNCKMAKSAPTTIVEEHRRAASRQRKALADPKKARAFLIRAGILSKGGKRLSERYR